MLRLMTYSSLLLVAVSLHATPIVDQSSLVENATMAAFYQTDLAQSFQQANSNISGAEFKLTAGFGSGLGDITIQLYDLLPNAGGTLMAGGTALGVAGGDFATVFWSPVTVIPDTTYYLVVTSTNSSLALAGDVFNGYPRGLVFANPGFQSFPGFDYTFQTYFDYVPEPSSTILLATGLVAIGLLLRRRSA